MPAILFLPSAAGEIRQINGWIWGWPLLLLILGAGVYLTVRCGLVQVRCWGEAWRCIVRKETGGGEISPFGALCTSLSATVGTGNIVGVATAVTLGGPGALFWMLVAAFFGMATKYAEGVLAVKYRVEPRQGHFLGGPFYYIENGMGARWRWLAKLFALFGALAGVMGIGTMAQVHGIAAAAEETLDSQRLAVAFSVGGRSYTWSVVISGLVVTILAALVLIGGVRRIAAVSQVAVPLMAVLYVVLTGIILLRRVTAIPAAVTLVVRCAVCPASALGAVAGVTLKQVMQKGIGRGVFSNEAGLGSAPIAAAAAKTADPVRQGLVSMMGTFIDTMLICTMTGLSILVTDAWRQRGLEGVKITAFAWQTGLPWPPAVSACLLTVCLSLFAFTTILGWNYYAERCLEYLTDGNRKALRLFRLLYILAVLVGPYLTVSAVWNTAEIFNGLMAVPNLIALLSLSGVAATETTRYRAAIKNR